MALLFILHFAVTWFLIGLIWLIQVVHYPLFAKVGSDSFVEYAQIHSRTITWIVAPTMLIEGATGLGLLLDPMRTPSIALIANIVLLVATWISTFAIQVPIHAKLQCEFCPVQHRKLVASNWIRTVAWTTRGIMLVFSAMSFMR